MHPITLGSDELVPIADLAIELGIAPAALYYAGTRKELELVKGSRGWMVRRWEGEVWARLQALGSGVVK